MSAPSDGQVLKYNASQSKWTNANEAGGSTPTLDQVLHAGADSDHAVELTGNDNTTLWLSGGGGFQLEYPGRISLNEGGASLQDDGNGNFLFNGGGGDVYILGNYGLTFNGSAQIKFGSGCIIHDDDGSGLVVGVNGLTAPYALNVAAGNIVTTAHNTLDGGSGQMSIAQDLTLEDGAIIFGSGGAIYCTNGGIDIYDGNDNYIGFNTNEQGLSLNGSNLVTNGNDIYLNEGVDQSGGGGNIYVEGGTVALSGGSITSIGEASTVDGVGSTAQIVIPGGQVLQFSCGLFIGTVGSGDGGGDDGGEQPGNPDGDGGGDGIGEQPGEGGGEPVDPDSGGEN